MKSPLRYPGGKSKALSLLLPEIGDCKEFREPFVGGASVSLEVAERSPRPLIWINDLNEDLIAFWRELQVYPEQLIETVSNSLTEFSNEGRDLYEGLKDFRSPFDEDLAVRFFILNRITFSGLLECGGYSQEAFEKRFTQSSIDRLKAVNLDGFKITHGDYEPVVTAPGEDVVIFLDPPYAGNEKSKLYGKKGDLHKGFDHERLARVLKSCPHRWLMTYDDCPQVRELYEGSGLKTFELQYGMNNYKQKSAKKGCELLIKNW